MLIPFPKIVYPSGGSGVLYPSLPAVRLAAYDKRAKRTDSISTAGVKQSVFLRQDDFLRLRFHVVPSKDQLIARSEEPELVAPWAHSADLDVGENYLIRAEEFEHSAWVKTGAGGGSAPTVTANQANGPDESVNTADLIEFPAVGVGETSSIYQLATGVPEPASQKFTVSIFLKTTTAPATIRLYVMNQGLSGFGFTDMNVTTSWQRFEATGASGGGDTNVGILIQSIGINGPENLYAWGAQLEYGNVASDYTATTTVTKALEIADPFWIAAESGTPGAPLGLNSRFPKRGRQIVRHGSGGWALSQIGQTDVPLMGRTLIHSGYMKEHTDTTTVGQYLRSCTSGGLFIEENNWTDHTLTSAWKRFSIVYAFGGRHTNWRIDYLPNQVGTFYLFGAQLAESLALVEYRRSGSGQEGEVADWAAFIDDAMQGNAFDYYPNYLLDGSTFETYTLEDTSWAANFRFRHHFNFDVLFRKEV